MAQSLGKFYSQVLGCSPSSVSREINKNIPPAMRRYPPHIAHELVLKQRKSLGRKGRLKNQVLRYYAAERPKLGWSPEKIAAMAKAAVGTIISS